MRTSRQVKVIYALLVLFTLNLLLFSPVFAVSDFPYSHPNTAGTCTANGLTGSDISTGVYSSDFTGQTIVSIGFYLCSQAGFGNDLDGGWNTACATVTEIGIATIGIFDIATGALVHPFGTVPWASMPCHDGTHDPAPQEFIVSISVSLPIMLSNQFVGVTFTSSNGQNIVSGDSDKILTIKSGGNMAMTNGGIQDEAPGCMGVPCQSHGLALAGDISAGSPPKPSGTASGTASVIIPAVMIILIATIVIKAVKSPIETEKKIDIATGGVIAIGVIFAVFLLVGL